MDGVTASGIRIEALAFAQASGDFVLAQTRSDALVSTIGERELGIGFAQGLAFACCDRESDVAVQSGVNTDGQIVRSNSHTVTFRGAFGPLRDQAGYFAYGYTATFLVARSPGDQPGSSVVREPSGQLGEGLSGVIDVRQGQGRGAVMSGFELVPMLLDGLRGRLFHGLPGVAPTRATRATASFRPSPARLQ